MGQQNSNVREMTLLRISIGGFALLALSFPAMQLLRSLSFLPGMMFWLGLITGVTGQILLERCRKSFFAAYKVSIKKYQKVRCGMLSLFSNPAAKAADIALGFCVFLAILLWLFPMKKLDLRYILLALTVFSFCMHCVLNGRNYLFAHNKNRVRQVLEQQSIRNY